MTMLPAPAPAPTSAPVIASDRPRVSRPTAGPPPRRTVHRRRAPRGRPNFLAAFGGTLWLAVIILPLYYIVVTSLRRQAGFFSQNPLAFPTDGTLENYAFVLQNGFDRYFLNSVVVTVTTVLVVLVVTLLAAYVIARNLGGAPQRMFRLLLIGLAIPVQATIIPIYYLMSYLGLYDTLVALILPSVAFAIPISTLILVNFVRDIPGELFESMRIDGASDMRILWQLVVPLSRPAIATVAIYDAMHVWNGFLFPLILTQSQEMRVLPLSLWSFQGEFTVNVPAVMAAVVLSALPLVIVYAMFSKQLVGGLTAGFGK